MSKQDNFHKYKNNFAILDKVIADKRLTHLETRIYTRLFLYSGGQEIYPSRKTIAEKTGISDLGRISRAVKKLTELGYLETHHRFNNSNLYKISSGQNQYEGVEITTTPYLKQPLPSGQNNYGGVVKITTLNTSLNTRINTISNTRDEEIFSFNENQNPDVETLTEYEGLTGEEVQEFKSKYPGWDYKGLDDYVIEIKERDRLSEFKHQIEINKKYQGGKITICKN